MLRRDPTNKNVRANKTFVCLTCKEIEYCTYNSKNEYCSKKCLPICAKGVPKSLESRNKMSVAKKGKHISPETEFKKGSNIGKEYRYTDGNIPWHKGRTGVYTPEQMERMQSARLANKWKVSGELCYRWKGGRPKCIDCNAQLTHYSKGRCSKCNGLHRSGENSTNWRGGVSKESKLLRTKFERDVRPSVMHRDDYTCQICQARGGKLHVDHIKKWSDYPELRFSMDNCRTLCVPCHYEVTFNRVMPKNISWGQPRKRIL